MYKADERSGPQWERRRGVPSGRRWARSAVKWLLLASLLFPWRGGSTPSVARADSGAGVRLRTELSGGNTFTSDGVWLHDAYAVHALEVEWMVFGPLSMGLRLLPVIAYFGREPIIGSGLGVTNRIYSARDGTGFYVGLAACAVVHTDRFEGNSSNINFLSSIDMGYHFPRSRYRAGIKLEHVSNANLADHNRGWNGVSVLVGATL